MSAKALAGARRAGYLERRHRDFALSLGRRGRRRLLRLVGLARRFRGSCGGGDSVSIRVMEILETRRLPRQIGGSIALGAERLLSRGQR